MNDLFRRAIDMLNDAVFIAGTNLKIEECNAKFIELFCGGRNPRGKLLLEAVRSVSLFEEVSAASGGAASVFEFCFDGRVLSGHVRFFEAEKRIVCVIKDETSTRKLEKVRKDFVSNMTHQMKTPLTPIIGYSETLASGDIEDATTVRKCAGIIHDNAVKLRDLIDEILTLSRLEGGMVEVRKNAVDLFEVLVKCIERFSDNSKGVDIELLGESRIIETDPVMLEHIVSNIIDNAVKFSNVSGKVTVAVRSGGDMVIISVADSGCGIPEEKLHRIFERFYRVEENSEAPCGFGLGLSIAKHFADKLNVEIAVESAPQKGSVFSIVVPVK